MLPMGSIFFPLRVAPMRIENNFKRHLIENFVAKTTIYQSCKIVKF